LSPTISFFQDVLPAQSLSLRRHGAEIQGQMTDEHRTLKIADCRLHVDDFLVPLSIENHQSKI
jgi:hypothetical protein